MVDMTTEPELTGFAIDAAPAELRLAPLDWLLSFHGLDATRIAANDFVPAAEWIRDGLDADNVHVVLAGSTAVNPRFVGSAHGPSSDPSLVTASDAILAAVLGDGQSILLDEAGQNSPFAADPQLQQFNVVAVLCVPMTLSGRCIGAIYADARSQRTWTEGDLAVIELAAGLLALLWDHRRLLCQSANNAAMVEAGLAAQKMSHAVKNILQMVCGAGEVIEFALKNKHYDRLQRSWNILQPNLQRMKKFTLDMLDFSRPRPFDFAPADPATLIASVAQTFAPVLQSRSVKLDLWLDAAPKSVPLDSDRAAEMLGNLILYSLDRIGSQSGSIRIECRPNADLTAVEILISDSGPAVEPATANQIFTPYEPTRDQLSTGLGLAIARRIAQTHNGSIALETTSSGSAFRITLPLTLAR